jgi:hypothetical protein
VSSGLTKLGLSMKMFLGQIATGEKPLGKLFFSQSLPLGRNCGIFVDVRFS